MSASGLIRKNFYLSRNLAEQLRTLSFNTRMSESAIVRDALKIIMPIIKAQHKDHTRREFKVEYELPVRMRKSNSKKP